ncbi:MAG: hypothetical protein LBU32_10605 [Clostridiales bacterium]|nr:hypothetical protein [Clostridiales bacterium]
MFAVGANQLRIKYFGPAIDDNASRQIAGLDKAKDFLKLTGSRVNHNKRGRHAGIRRNLSFLRLKSGWRQGNRHPQEAEWNNSRISELFERIDGLEELRSLHYNSCGKKKAVLYAVFCRILTMSSLDGAKSNLECIEIVKTGKKERDLSKCDKAEDGSPKKNKKSKGRKKSQNPKKPGETTTAVKLKRAWNSERRCRIQAWIPIFKRPLLKTMLMA